MVFSSTSVLLFVCLYYIIDERIPQAALYWQKYQNIILLLFLVFSVFYDKLVRYPVRSVNCNSDQTKGVRAADLCILYYSDLIVYQVHLP